MLQQALQKAKKEEEKKVSINFQVPYSLKEEFDNLCRDNKVSLTAMLNSLMEVALDESKGLGNEELKYAKSLLRDANTFIAGYLPTEEELDSRIQSLKSEPQNIIDNEIEAIKYHSNLYNDINEFILKD